MDECVHIREISNIEGNKLYSIVHQGTGSVVRWRRAQVVLWSAQGMEVPQIAPLAFTAEHRVRVVIHNFNADGLDSLAPKYGGGRLPKFTLPEPASDCPQKLIYASDHARSRVSATWASAASASANPTTWSPTGSPGLGAGRLKTGCPV